MKLAKLKNSDEKVIVLIPSKEYNGIYEDRRNGNSIIKYNTLNHIVDENYKHRFVFDDDINLGEIVIALDKAEEMTNSDVSFSKNREQELYFLISHGLMHLLGFDHRDEEEYNFIVSEQKKALECINYDKI